VAALDEYYGQVLQDPNIPALVINEPHPRFFPYPTKFEEWNPVANVKPTCTEFEYIDAFRADPTNLTFLAKVKSSGQKLVIKFVGRYGTEAHQLLADAKMAPRLLYCGRLDGKRDVRSAWWIPGLYVGPVSMVVTEHIEGNTTEKESAWPKDARQKIEKAIQKLHDAKLVFGDLRASSVMFSGDNVFFTDFGWAGRVDEVVDTLMDHDWFMLDQFSHPLEDNWSR